ncbi:MAG TPA: HAD-IIA family hydrolase [Anaerolineae bacterium]|nr:HAD-IIA family hydrolase [Anaerolineae bacterium]
MSEKPIAAIILAAGESARMGAPKQLLNWNGRPLIVHMVEMTWNVGLTPVVVVLGAHSDQILPALAGLPVQIVQNYRWQEGMSASLNVGLAALPPDVAAALILPVDQPLLTPGHLRGLMAQWRQTHGIVVSGAPGERRGTPAVFSREFFPELASLSGDMGGRALFDRYAPQLNYTPVPNAEVFTDIDTPEVYTQLREAAGTARPPSLSAIRGVICDMDGVLWRGNTPLPGLHEFFTWMHARNLKYVLVTNNSSRTPQMYVEKLAGMGITTTPEHVLTSSQGAADYLITVQPPDAAVYAIGGTGVMDALRARGFQVLTDDATDQADYVVVGWDQQFSWRKLATATRLIRAGAQFIATNPDRTYPTEEGLVPGNGAQVAALEVATGQAPVMIGKPEPVLYEQALTRMGTTPETTLVIGDRLDTDILGGIRLGMSSALVLSGVSDAETLRASPIRPDRVFANLLELVQVWQEDTL